MDTGVFAKLSIRKRRSRRESPRGAAAATHRFSLSTFFSREKKVVRRFTLIELVVAMAIMMLVAMIIGVSSSTFYNGYQRSQRASARLEEYIAIDRIWDNLIRNMVPFQWVDDEGISRFVFEGEEETLHFVALRRLYGDDPGAFLFVRLFVEDEQLVAEYADYPRVQWDESDEMRTWKREIIAREVKAISFQYAELDEEEDEISWEDYWEEEEHAAIPLAVRMCVEWNDGTVEYWLRRVAGAGRNTTLGNRETVSEDDEDVDAGNRAGSTRMSSSGGGR